MGQALPAINAEANQAPQAVQWLIVPRHPQRFDEVFALLSSAGLRVARRSQWGQPPQDADVWLGDTLGEMALFNIPIAANHTQPPSTAALKT